MADGKTYLMFKTGFTNLESSGLTNVLERTPRSVAEFYLMNYNDEDLPRIRGGSGAGDNPGYDAILENNTLVKNIINNARKGSTMVVNVKSDNEGFVAKKDNLRISNADQMRNIKIALFKIQDEPVNPDYTVILGAADLREVNVDTSSSTPTVNIIPPFSTDEFPQSIFCPPSADPDVESVRLSYTLFKEKTPEIWNEMKAYYDKLKKEFESNIDRLRAMKLPGVSTASTFTIDEFSVDALKRSTHNEYMANSFGIQQILKMYLPIIFSGEAITKEEANSIAASFGIGMTEGIIDLAKNSPNFHGFFSRPHGVTRMDTICNFMKLFNVICTYGEQKKFKGGLYNLKRDPITRILNTTVDFINDKISSDTNVQNKIREQVFKHIVDGMIGKRIRNPLSIVVTFTGKGSRGLKKIFGTEEKHSKGAFNIEVYGASMLRPLKVSKIKSGIAKVLNEILDDEVSINETFELSIDLPAGKYVYK